MIVDLFLADIELPEEEMSKYWAKHKPNEKKDTSSQEYDLASDVESYQVLVYDPVQMCYLCLDEIILHRALRWLRIGQHCSSSDEINQCVIQGYGSLSGDDNDVVGHLPSDECAFYLLI